MLAMIAPRALSRVWQDPVMLFVHEIQRVMGLHEDAFEHAYREVWMPRLAETDDARLLYFAKHAHGTGRAYNIITLTAVTDGQGWERLVTRLRTGDLREWVANVDTMRHDVTSKVLIPVEWSPLQTVDLANVPTGGNEHDPTLFMEDTAWIALAQREQVDAVIVGPEAPLAAGLADQCLALGLRAGSSGSRARSVGLRRWTPSSPVSRSMLVARSPSAS